MGLFHSLRTPPRLTRCDWALALLPAILWYLTIEARPHLIRTWCSDPGARCTANAVAWPDRLAIRPINDTADGVSFIGQYAAGALALAGPPAARALRLVPGPMTWTTLGTDAVILLETVLWNGLTTEAVRQAVSRPRPFVYRVPEASANPANYISFYSGHSSFAAAAGACLIVTLAARGLAGLPLAGFSAASVLLALVTAAGRVVAGRHFPTDAAAGLIAGVLVALTVARIHRKRY